MTEYQVFDLFMTPPVPVGPIFADKAEAENYAEWLGDGVEIRSREISEWAPVK